LLVKKIYECGKNTKKPKARQGWGAGLFLSEKKNLISLNLSMPDELNKNWMDLKGQGRYSFHIKKVILNLIAIKYIYLAKL
jgi:hypothetical protein